MNSFQNRQGENLNKKVFEVTDVQRDGTGEIVQIKGNLFRDDSEGLIQEGTPLEAETLTEIVKALAKEVSKVISKEVIEKYVDYTVEEYIVDVPYEINDWETAEIIIPTSEDLNVERVKVYDDIFNYNFQFLSEWNYISLLVSTKAGVTDPGIYEYDHKFVLRSKTTDEIIKKVYLKLVLSTPSTTPED